MEGLEECKGCEGCEGKDVSLMADCGLRFTKTCCGCCEPISGVVGIVLSLGGVVGGDIFGAGVVDGRGLIDVARDGVGLGGGMSGSGL